MREADSLSAKWTVMSLLVTLVTASVITFLVYEGGRLLGFS